MKVYVMSMTEWFYDDKETLISDDRQVMGVFKDPNDAIGEAVAKGYEDFWRDASEDVWHSRPKAETICHCEYNTIIDIKGYELQ